MTIRDDVVVRVLGPITAAVGDETTSLGGPMQHRILAVLTAAGGDPVGIDVLIGELWADGHEPADPNRTIRNLVSRLRSVLGDDSVVTHGGGYSLGAVSVDADRFEELVRLGWTEQGSLSAINHWGAALRLWSGQAFEGYEDLATITARARRLEELRAETTEAWIEARLSAGERSELVPDVNEAIRRYPLREHLRHQQMHLLAAMGRQAEALRAFQAFRRELVEIGLEPSPELVELEQQIAAGRFRAVGHSAIPLSRVRGYRIGEELGRGRFAVVYKARQPTIGRDVALKVIRAELADRPDFIAQFEAEAQLVARLEHPNVVPLHDYWREPGAAYLVMRYLPGGSLAELIADGQLAPRQVAELGRQIAAALDEAHARGVVHGDVRPANILMDDRRRAYLTDFSIATTVDGELPPADGIDRGVDIHGLAVTLFEALVGTGLLEHQPASQAPGHNLAGRPLPLVRVLRPELPAGIDTVLRRATSAGPEHRYRSAGEMAEAMSAAVGLSTSTAQGGARSALPRNPYKGLRAFTEADAADFVGRERLIERLARSVGAHPLTMAVGASGSGKSSLVAAGLIPALRADRSREGRWFVTAMTPGSDPFAALSQAIRQIAIDQPDDLPRRLRADHRAVAGLVRRAVPSGGRSVLVIDQFEELYTLTSPEDRARFIEVLLTLTAAADSNLHIVASLRADFFHHPLASPGLVEAIDHSTVAVHPPTPEELERAIVEPAAAVGVEFERGVVARLLADVAGQPGSLPLLQHTLTELFERRAGTTISMAAYQAGGGVAGALGRKAEELHASLLPDERQAARRLFGRLVTVGDNDTVTRRRVRRSDISRSGSTDSTDLVASEPSPTAGQPDPVDGVIDRYGAARLLSFDHDPATRQPTLELAHESLITEWHRLGDWIAEDRSRLQVHQHLRQAAANWDRFGRDAADLYRGARLAATLDMIGDPGDGTAPVLDDLEQQFLDRSVDREEAATASERATNRRLQDLVDRQSTGNRRLRRLLAFAAAAATVALVAGAVAWQQRNQAASRQREAEIAGLVAESLRQAADDPVLAGLLAVEAYGHDATAAAPALFAALVASPGLNQSVSWPDAGGERACGSLGPHGAVLAPATTPGPVRLLARNGDHATIDAAVICWVAADPRGRYVAAITADDGNELKLWERSTGDLLASRTLDLGPAGLAWRPDGSAIAVLHNVVGSGFSQGERLDVLTVPDLQRQWPIDTFTDRPWVLDWSDDSSTLLIGSLGGGQEPALLSALDAENGDVGWQTTLDDNPGHVQLSADGRRVAVVFNSGVVEVRDVVSATAGTAAPVTLRLEEGRFDSRPVRSWLVLEPELLLVAHADGSASLLDTELGEERFEPLRLGGIVEDAQWRGGELRVVTNDGTLRTLELGRAGPSLATTPLPARLRESERSRVGRTIRIRPYLNVTVSAASNRRVFVATQDLTVAYLDLDRIDDPGDPVRPIAGPFSSVSYQYVGLPDGRIGYLPPIAGFVIYDSAGGTIDEILLGTDLDVSLVTHDVAANETGRVAILAREAPTRRTTGMSDLPLEGQEYVILLDSATGEKRRISLPDGTTSRSVRVGPDGRAVAGLTDGRVATVDWDGSVELVSVEPEVAVASVAIRPDGTLVVATASGRLWLVDGDDLTLITRAAESTEDVRTIEWADQVITTDGLGSMRLWDLTDGRELALLRQGPGVADALPVVDEIRQWVWVPGTDSLEAISTDPAVWAETLCRRTSRRLTETERDNLLLDGLRSAETNIGCGAP